MLRNNRYPKHTTALGRKQTFCQDQQFSASNVRFRPEANIQQTKKEPEPPELYLPSITVINDP
jgi:hypothetical protein